MWFPKIKKIQKLNLLKSGLNGGQKGILFFVHVNMNVSHIILILVANWQEIFGEWLINPRPRTKSSEVTLCTNVHFLFKSRNCNYFQTADSKARSSTIKSRILVPSAVSQFSIDSLLLFVAFFATLYSCNWCFKTGQETFSLNKKSLKKEPTTFHFE